MFEPLDTAPAYLRLSAAIRARILGRELGEGDSLPTETELARQFAVNRSTVREALRNLQSAGLVERRGGGKKLYVSRPAVGAVGDGLREALTLHEARFADVWEALLALEPAVAAAAAKRRDAVQLAELEAIAVEFGASEKLATEAVALVGRFFRALGRASANPVFVLANEPLVQLVEPSLAIIIDRLPQARRRIAAAQRAMVTAIRARDRAAAADWMRRHVEDFRRGFEQAGLPLETVVR
ncbi:MAG: GntR family transcriptional regulator [Steroidobacteraceae bacterium]|jgi:DNA-binding FadR family transcriptional regulator|nr:GntR family transcriptional regulator [Steroidobacteraceae bacterium]